MDPTELLAEMGGSLRKEYYTDGDVDLRAPHLIVHPDDHTVDCPVCLVPVAASPSSTQRRYGAAPDLITGYYRHGPSPTLYTLSCGHRIELAGDPS